MQADQPNRHGFTLVELMVVISIIALLVAMLLPALGKSRDVQRDILCKSTLRGMMTATNLYAIDWQSWMPHGKDMGGFGWQITAYERAFYPTNAYDDDWLDSKPGTEGRNRFGGGQNICGAGQLMWDNYLPDKGEAIACPQADYREYKWTDTEGDMVGFKEIPFSWAWNRSAVTSVAQGKWRNDAYSGNSSYENRRTTYDVRGTLFRLVDSEIRYRNHRTPLRPSRNALFADHEQANATHLTAHGLSSGSGKSPVGHWPRVHRQGLNVVYLDAHVQRFSDEGRVHTFNYSNDIDSYGSGWVLGLGGYDLD